MYVYNAISQEVARPPVISHPAFNCMLLPIRRFVIRLLVLGNWLLGIDVTASRMIDRRVSRLVSSRLT